MDKINLARRAFFLGLREEGRELLTVKPSVRQVAEFLNLPTLPLQRVAVREGLLGPYHVGVTTSVAQCRLSRGG